MTGIFIITYNTPSDVFLCQMEAIKKFCKDDGYIVEIWDNSSEEEFALAISYHCENRGVKYTRAKVGNLDPSRSHACAANMAYFVGSKIYDNFFFLDHDCIPIADFDVESELIGIMAKGIGQGAKKTYFWPGCFMFSGLLGDYIDFTPNGQYGLDTGGNLYQMIDELPKEKFKFIGEEYRENPDYNGKYNFYSVIDGRFMHFINTSNWNRQEDNEQRINSLLGIAKNYINGKDTGISEIRVSRQNGEPNV